MTEETRQGARPPRARPAEHRRRGGASGGAQARMVSTQGRESMRPPQGHIVAAATREEIDGIRGPARIVRQLEFYKTFYGPVVRLAFTVYPMDGEPLSAATLLNVSQVSGDAALTGPRSAEELLYPLLPGRRRRPRLRVLQGDPQRPGAEAEAKKVLKMARDAYTETPEERRSFRSAVGLAERQFELPVPEPDEEAIVFGENSRVYCRHMPAGSASEDFVTKISRALSEAGRRGIHVTAGAGSCDLEAQQFAHLPAEDEEDADAPWAAAPPGGAAGTAGSRRPRRDLAALLLPRWGAELARDRTHRDGPRRSSRPWPPRSSTAATAGSRGCRWRTRRSWCRP